MDSIQTRQSNNLDLKIFGVLIIASFWLLVFFMIASELPVNNITTILATLVVGGFLGCSLNGLLGLIRSVVIINRLPLDEAKKLIFKEACFQFSLISLIIEASFLSMLFFIALWF